jgi:cation transporter-like permease
MFKSFIVCDGSTKSDPCNFDALVELAVVVMHNIIVLATLLAVIGFILAGFKLLTSGGNPAAKAAAKKILGNVVWGFVWVLAAWLVIYTISKVLLDPNTQPTPLINRPSSNSGLTP